MANLMNLKFTVVKNVTLPLLKKKDDGTPVYVKIDSAIYKAKDNKTGKPAEGETKKAMEAPELVQVTNLETGEQQEMIVESVLGIELRDQYPDNGYLGKCFSISKFAKTDGKRYATFQIAEIALEASEPAVAEDTGEVKQEYVAPAATGKHKR